MKEIGLQRVPKKGLSEKGLSEKDLSEAGHGFNRAVNAAEAMRLQPLR
jgi:hypothetical protein